MKPRNHEDSQLRNHEDSQLRKHEDSQLRNHEFLIKLKILIILSFKFILKRILSWRKFFIIKIKNVFDKK